MRVHFEFDDRDHKFTTITQAGGEIHIRYRYARKMIQHIYLNPVEIVRLQEVLAEMIMEGQGGYICKPE